MKKFLLIFISIFSLFVGAEGKAHVHTHLSRHGLGVLTQEGVSNVGSFADVSKTYIVNSSSTGVDKSFEIKATEDEIEEDKLIPANKNFVSAGMASAIFWVLIVGYFSSYLKKGFTLREHLTYSPSPRRTILLQVFRL